MINSANLAVDRSESSGYGSVRLLNRTLSKLSKGVWGILTEPY
jgi:hypothetical protein